MSRHVFEIVAASEASLLCRILGYLAQLDAPAPEMTVSLTKGRMRVRMMVEVPEKLAEVLEARFSNLVRVESVELRTQSAACEPEAQVGGECGSSC